MSLLDWFIKKIIYLYYKLACFLGKYIGTFFLKVFIFVSHHIKSFLIAFIILFCSLLRIQHSKIGLFFGCKDYVHKNYFEKPCNIVFHYPNVQTMKITHKDKTNVKKK